jgi:hypothetical protein
MRRPLDDTPMPESVEVLDRPRFQQQTQIAQARYTRSQISQIDSRCFLRVLASSR